MENPTSFRLLLQNISEAISVKESATDYDNLLRKIFEEEKPHDQALADDTRSNLVSENFRSEEVFGRDQEKKLLLSKLIDPDEKLIQLFVIPILGDSGMGKTTLARLVYEDEVVKEHFELQAWVKVDGEELDLQHAAHGILKSTMGMSCSLDDLDELDEMVRDILQSHRCLIVFDGIETMAMDSWLHMKDNWFDFVDLGSKVLITTPSNDVADLVAYQPFELTQLSFDDGLSLFRYFAFGSSKSVVNMSNSLVKSLSALCQGIPLSLKLAGSLMRYDDKLSNLLSSVDFSDNISLSPCDVLVVVLLCVWGLPPHLRRCLAYSAIFPKGFPLRKEKIIDMWIAHGLVKPCPGKKSQHDIGDSYFHQLLCRSFFTDITRDQKDDVIEFQIPRLIHKMAEDVARIVYKEKLGLIGSIGEDAGQLSLILPIEGKYNLEHLQTLILSPTIYSGGSLDHSLLYFQELQSLDLSCSGIRNLPDDICALKELRYLSLSFTLIERLPDSITNLSQLQTLDLSWCYHLKFLPRGICNLTHMSHLDLSLCESLSYFPFGIGFLISLSSMPLFVMGKDHDCAHLGELGRLNQLRGRLEIRGLENVREISEARDAKLDQKNLHHLRLSWSENADDCFEVLELLQPNPQLQVLDLNGYLGFGFPRWISCIDSLIMISISDCGCKEPPSLGQLPFLKELQLKGMTNLERIGTELYGDGNADHVFPSLEQIELYDLPRLLEWLGETLPNSSGISFPCVFRRLKTLTIEGCAELPSLPSLPTLFDLIVCNSNKSILSSLTSFTSLSSLLINDMELGVSFRYLGTFDSLKKLILCNIKDTRTILNEQLTFSVLEHLGILHCHELRSLHLYNFSSLQRLHIVDCQDLLGIWVSEVEKTPLMELVIEDCPRAFAYVSFSKFHNLRKLMLKNCSSIFAYYLAGDIRKLEKLDYLFISGCPEIERDMESFPWLVSHIPCVILGNHKTDYKDIIDLRKDVIKDPFESIETELFSDQIQGHTWPSKDFHYSKKSKAEREAEDFGGGGASFDETTAANAVETTAANAQASTGTSAAERTTENAADTMAYPEGSATTAANAVEMTAANAQIEGSRIYDSGLLEEGDGSLEQSGREAADEPQPNQERVPEKKLSHLISTGNKGHLEQFSLKVLLKATDNFSEDLKIGTGSYGSVYHATLDDGCQVAIKRAESSSSSSYAGATRRGQEDKDSVFLNEIEFLSRVNHKNLVRLLGYCEDRNERVLVYEYMDNGTLSDHLHRLESSPLMSWPNRIKVALDAAKGIEYLHEYAVPRIIHRDIKSSNILLDATWTAKVSNFGLSLMGPQDDESHLSLPAAGTMGYMDPEYYRLQLLTTKSDVYSFGIVLLELLSGWKAIQKNENGMPRNVVDFAIPYIIQDEIHRVLDRRMLPPTAFEIEAVAYVGYIAADCVMPEGRDRPTMTEVVNGLDRALEACFAPPVFPRSTSGAVKASWQSGLEKC